MARDPHKPPTPAQHAATMRNWTVRGLRALFSQASGGVFLPAETDAIHGAIDSALARLGAETGTARRKRLQAE